MRKTFYPLLLMLLVGTSAVSGQRKIDERRPFAPDGSIRIFNAVGTVRVIAWSRDSIWVTGTVWEDRDRFMIGNDTNAMKLGIWDYASGRAIIKPSQIEVHVPARASVWVKTATADIEALGLAGSADLNSVSGKIRVVAGPKDINIESMSGDVDAFVASPVLRIRTASGAIGIRGASQDISANTVSGNVKVNGGPIDRGRFETVTGAIDFDGSFLRGASLEFQTHSGGVELRLPANTDADFIVSTFGGQLRNELARRQQLASRRDLRGQELSFTNGKGGSNISVRTFNGDIVLAGVLAALKK
jgi:hypothetical protein